MTGYVWEEKINNTLNNVKTGDGIYNNGQEEKINNIEIELVEKLKGNNNEDLEYIHAQTFSGADAYTYVDNGGQTQIKAIEAENGTYLFKDMIPGDYVIRFIYGEEETSIEYNGQDYKSTPKRGISIENASDAGDNKTRRKELIDITKTISNEKAQILANPTSNIEAFKQLAGINADTDNLNVNIEYDNQKYGSLDLGLVRRPQTRIDLTKEIIDIDLSNDGVTFINLKNGITNGMIITKDLKKDINRRFFLYMDNELIHGAQLNITYKIVIKNNSDMDNLANYFEYDPAYGSVEEQNKPITTTVDMVYDYSGTLGFPKEKNAKWNAATDLRLLSEGVRNYINLNSDKITVIGTNALGKAIIPGETAEIELILSRVIGTSKQEDQIYLNEIEIVQITNGAGRKDEEAVPGNHTPNGEGTKERDEWDTDFIITKPTGQPNTKLYILFAACLGGVLVLGIVLIKKYVLDKRW